MFFIQPNASRKGRGGLGRPGGQWHCDAAFVASEPLEEYKGTTFHQAYMVRLWGPHLISAFHKTWPPAFSSPSLHWANSVGEMCCMAILPLYNSTSKCFLLQRQWSSQSLGASEIGDWWDYFWVAAWDKAATAASLLQNTTLWFMAHCSLIHPCFPCTCPPFSPFLKCCSLPPSLQFKTTPLVRSRCLILLPLNCIAFTGFLLVFASLFRPNVDKNCMPGFKGHSTRGLDVYNFRVY